MDNSAATKTDILKDNSKTANILHVEDDKNILEQHVLTEVSMK